MVGEQHLHVANQLVDGKVDDGEVPQKPLLSPDELLVFHHPGVYIIFPLLLLELFDFGLGDF